MIDFSIFNNKDKLYNELCYYLLVSGILYMKISDTVKNALNRWKND